MTSEKVYPGMSCTHICPYRNRCVHVNTHTCTQSSKKLEQKLVSDQKYPFKMDVIAERCLVFTDSKLTGGRNK